MTLPYNWDSIFYLFWPLLIEFLKWRGFHWCSFENTSSCTFTNSCLLQWPVVNSSFAVYKDTEGLKGCPAPSIWTIIYAELSPVPCEPGTGAGQKRVAAQVGLLPKPQTSYFASCVHNGQPVTHSDVIRQEKVTENQWRSNSGPQKSNWHPFAMQAN